MENGEWKDIDNSLQYEGKAFEDAAGYTNAANDFQVRFAEQTLQDEFISVQQGEYKLDWKYVGATDEVTPTPTSVPTPEPTEEPESEMPTENDAENTALHVLPVQGKFHRTAHAEQKNHGMPE